MSRGPSHGRPRIWATWASIWAKAWARAEGTGWVVVGPGGDADVAAAMLVVDDVDDVAAAGRDATLLVPPSAARMTMAANPAARRATMRPTRATRGAGARIARHGTGPLAGFR